jgi:hypothetical protein
LELDTVTVVGFVSAGGAQSNAPPDGCAGEQAAVDTVRDARVTETLPAASRDSSANVYDVPHVSPLTGYVSEPVCPSRVPFRYTE